MVPTRALVDVQGRKSLLTVSNGTVVEKHITVDYSDDRNTVVKTGIESGDLIIADGVNKIRPGTTVTPQISQDSSKVEK